MDAAPTAKLAPHHLHRQSQSLFHLTYSGCEARDSQKSKLNHCTSQEPNGEKTGKEVSGLDVEGKPQRIYYRENPHSHEETANQIHIVPQCDTNRGS